MKIDGSIRSLQSGSVAESQTRGSKSGSTAGASGTGAGSPRVELSNLGSQLAGIEASLADVPVVDVQRGMFLNASAPIVNKASVAVS